MRQILPLSFALLCLWTIGACSTGVHLPNTADGDVKKGELTTRTQLLSAVNHWMRNHNQPELTADELLGRVVDEASTATCLGKGLEPPVESFIVCFKRNKRFRHPIKLQTDWTDSIKLSFSRQRLRLPPHHTLSLHILATYSDIWPSNEDPRKPIDLSMPLATALPGNQPGAKSLDRGRGKFQGMVETPEELLSAVNAQRRRARQLELTLDEITARTADELLFRHDLAEMLDPTAESFLESLARDRRFQFPTRLSADGFDEITISSIKERLRLSPHHALAVEIANHPLTNEDKRRYQVYINWTRIFLSYTFPEKEEARTNQISPPAPR